MRTLTFLSVMAVVLGFGFSALAADNTVQEFYAVSQLETNSNLQTMTDAQLTKVEGMSYSRHHDCGCHGKSSSSWTSIYQSNYMDQANLNFGGKRSGDVYQSNFGLQGNTATVR
jgi:hypothetical protein